MHNLKLNFVVRFSLIYVVDFFNYAMKNIERRWILKFICNYGLLRCVFEIYVVYRSLRKLSFESLSDIFAEISMLFMLEEVCPLWLERI